MAPPSRPEVDRRSFGPDFLRYHERLVPFFDGTIAALTAMSGLELVTANPIRLTVPSDWRQVVFAPGSGFLSPLGANQRLEYRTLEDGTVELQGVFGASSSKAPGTLISSLVPEVLPANRNLMQVYTESPVAAGSLSISSTGLRYETGSINAIVTNGATWTSKGRIPLAPGTPFPLPVAWKRLPSIVLVLAQVIGADKRPTSQWQLHPAAWSAPPERSTAAFSITRIPGLSVGRTYDLMVYAAA